MRTYKAHYHASTGSARSRGQYSGVADILRLITHSGDQSDELVRRSVGHVRVRQVVKA